MKNPILYFAYGSNMNPIRMAQRCPGAITLGVGVLRNYRLAERLYADIDFQEGAEVHGVLYLISEWNLRSLDARELEHDHLTRLGILTRKRVRNRDGFASRLSYDVGLVASVLITYAYTHI